MKKTNARYRAIENSEGDLVADFRDDDGEPISFEDRSTTYFPDDMNAIEETNRERMKNLIRGKTLTRLEVSR